jgi:magnesium transporter
MRSAKRGLGPGSLVHVGKTRNHSVKVRLMDYDAAQFVELEVSDLQLCDPFANSPSVTWIDVDGAHDASVVEEIGKKFGIHILVLEDVMNAESRPKVEFFDDYMFIVMKMIDADPQTGELHVEQFSLIAGEHYLITFQDQPGDSFDRVRDSIRNAKGRVRTKDARYLAYLLLDVIIDNYIVVSEGYAERIEAAERQVLARPNERVLLTLLALRKELMDFKRSIDPLKEAVNSIQREVPADIGKYYRDLYDHIVHESENLAMYREMLLNLLDLYHSTLSYRMNGVMKVLTVITTIFVPLTFFVGVYGMNFDNMPELRWHYGYYAAWAFMVVTIVLQFIYFRRKGWL